MRVLQEFADRGVNLSKIESRPLKQGLGRYIFFADLKGHASDDIVVAALEAVGSHARTLRVLGTYPVALSTPPSYTFAIAMEPSTATRTASPAHHEDGDVPPAQGPAGGPESNGPENGQRTSPRPERLIRAAERLLPSRRAVVLILKEKAELLEQGDRKLHSESMTLPNPVVIRLVTYVRVPRDSRSRRITRRAVFARDSWTCQYCGTTSHLTVTT